MKFAIDTEPRQVPVRLRGMPCGHLLQRRERVCVEIVGGGLDQHLHHGLAVRLPARPKPERDGIEIPQPPDGLIGERSAAERRDERRKVASILRLSGVEPALDGSSWNADTNVRIARSCCAGPTTANSGSAIERLYRAVQSVGRRRGARMKVGENGCSSLVVMSVSSARPSQSCAQICRSFVGRGRQGSNLRP